MIKIDLDFFSFIIEEELYSLLSKTLNFYDMESPLKLYESKFMYLINELITYFFIDSVCSSVCIIVYLHDKNRPVNK